MPAPHFLSHLSSLVPCLPACRSVPRLQYSMFVFDPQTRTYWFNPASLESEIEFALVGAVLGLAIYNGGLSRLHVFV